MINMRKCVLWGTAFMLVLAGCAKESSRTQISGKVTYKGDPVAGKTLNLVFDAPANESFSQMFPLSNEGTFTGEIPKPGTYKVVIADSLAEMDGLVKPGSVKTRFPAKYRDAAKSDITITIPTDKNEFTIELKD